MRQMPPSHYRSAPRAHQGANRRLLAPYMFARTERPTRLRVRATPSVRSPIARRPRQVRGNSLCMLIPVCGGCPRSEPQNRYQAVVPRSNVKAAPASER